MIRPYQRSVLAFLKHHPHDVMVFVWDIRLNQRNLIKKAKNKKINPIVARKMFGRSSSNVNFIKTSEPIKGVKSLH